MRNRKTLHVIAFDVPFPANYGGVIDIYYKIKALHESGIAIILHCFEYGRTPSPELSEICKKVYYYPRKTFKNFLYGDVPYIVASRDSDELLNNLLLDSNPILFEGLHSTIFLNNSLLKHRFKIVRTHNVEHDYYRHLEMVEKNFFKRYFFKLESEKLKKYQAILKHADLICAISPKDTAYFQKKFGKTLLIPAFHGNKNIASKEGCGTYILYHGNLAVGENHEAAMLLINEVFSKIKLPFVIAGSNPKKELRMLVESCDHVSLIDDRNTEQIHDLIANAQINLLFTAQDTGIKLKLLNALFTGRHCMVNHKMVDHTGLENLCHIANNSQEFISLIETYWERPFNEEMIEERKEFFKDKFNNSISIQKLIEAISFNAPQLQEGINFAAKPLIAKPKKVSLTLNSLLALLPF